MKTPAPLVSTELEAPVVSLRDGRPAPPELFQSVWERLARGSASWRPMPFGVARDPAEASEAAHCIDPAQSMSTDTASMVELVTSPARSIGALARQLGPIQEEAKAALEEAGYAMLGSGVHPTLSPTPEDYYRYRTPRPSYDYFVRERCWSHWTIANISSVQEIVDVDFDQVPRALRLLHRLAGLMNFVLRNDPDLLGDKGGLLSIRARAWRAIVPPAPRFAGDPGKLCVPQREIVGWRDYLSLLWETTPMFLVGTKNQGAAYLPEHPTFLRFLQDAPAGGWAARRLSGEEIRIVPQPADIEHSDWFYVGFARVRWKWRQDCAGVERFLDAWRRGEEEPFLRENVQKVVIENRCNSAQPPADGLVSVALVAGLLANLHESFELASREPYEFWLRVLDASTTEPLAAEVDGRSILGYGREMLDVGRRGLGMRGETDADTLLAPLYERLDRGRSAAEALLRAYRRGGVQGLLKHARI